jgi:hypothetical protein
MEETFEVDLSQFMAAIIEAMGGEVRIPYDSLQSDAKGIAIDFEEDGAILVLSLVEEIPSE